MRHRAALYAFPAVLLLAGCNLQVGGGGPVANPGELRDETVHLDKSKVEMVRAEFRMGAGELRIRGGSEKLMDARFQYNVEPWKPEVRYDATGFRGRLVVSQGSGTAGIGDVKNTWDVQLANDVPLDLEVSCGAGESELDLRGLTLRSVQVKLGAGKVDMDLRSDHKRDLDVKVEGGVGHAIIRVPKEASVVAEARGGIGDIRVSGLRKEDGRWVSDSYRKTGATISIDVRGGIGEIEIIAN